MLFYVVLSSFYTLWHWIFAWCSIQQHMLDWTSCLLKYIVGKVRKFSIVFTFYLHFFTFYIHFFTIFTFFYIFFTFFYIFLYFFTFFLHFLHFLHFLLLTRPLEGEFLSVQISYFRGFQFYVRTSMFYAEVTTPNLAWIVNLKKVYVTWVRI